MSDPESKSPDGEGAEEQAEASLLLDDILEATKVKPQDESYGMTRQGVRAFINAMLQPEKAGRKVCAAEVDEMIADLDRKLSAQMNAILHNAEFQRNWNQLGDR